MIQPTNIIYGESAQEIIRTYCKWLQYPVDHTINWPSTDMLIEHGGSTYLLRGSAQPIPIKNIKCQLMDHDPSRKELQELPLHTLVLFLNQYGSIQYKIRDRKELHLVWFITEWENSPPYCLPFNPLHRETAF